MTATEVQDKVLELLTKMNQGLNTLNEATDQINAMREEVLTMTTTNRVLIGELQVNDVKIEDSISSVQLGLSDNIETDLHQTIHINDIETKFKNDIQNLEEKHDKDIQDLDEDRNYLKTEVNKVEDSIDSIQYSLSNVFKTDLDQTMHIYDLEEKHSKDIQNLEEKHDKDIQDLDEKHTNDTLSLQRIISNLTTASVNQSIDIQNTYNFADEELLNQKLMQYELISKLMIATMISSIRSAQIARAMVDEES